MESGQKRQLVLISSDMSAGVPFDFAVTYHPRVLEVGVVSVCFLSDFLIMFFCAIISTETVLITMKLVITQLCLLNDIRRQNVGVWDQ